MGNYKKSLKYGQVYGDTIPTPVCRLVWPALKEPKAPPPPLPGQQQGLPRYEVGLLFPKNSQEHVAWFVKVGTMLGEMLVEFNKGRGAKLASVDPAKDGDTFDMQKYPYYKDQYVLTARNTAAPTLIDGLKAPADPAIFTGGCLVRAVITPLITSAGATYKLMIAQFIKNDGVAFASGVPSAASYIQMLDTVVPVELASCAASAALPAKEKPASPIAVKAIAPMTQSPARPGKKGDKTALDLL